MKQILIGAISGLSLALIGVLALDVPPAGGTSNANTPINANESPEIAPIRICFIFTPPDWIKSDGFEINQI